MTENRMKRKKTGMIWLIFTIIWMSVIFSFSAKKSGRIGGNEPFGRKRDREADSPAIYILVRRTAGAVCEND